MSEHDCDYDCPHCGQLQELTELAERGDMICWGCLKTQRDALLAFTECQAALDAWDEDATAEESLGITLSKHGLRWPTHGRFEQIKAVKRFEAARFVKDLRDRTLKLTKDQS